MRRFRSMVKGTRGRRVGLQIATDGLAWAVALIVATAYRYDFHLAQIDAEGVGGFIVVSFVVQTLAGSAVGLYRGRWRLGTTDELVALSGTVAAVGVTLAAADLAFKAHPVPVGAVFGGGVAAFVLMAFSRYVQRRAGERRLRPSGALDGRLLVFGAGEGGAQAIDAMLRASSGTHLPVALLDDDPRKRNLRIRGIPVVGDRTRVAAAAQEYEADMLLIAIPSGDATIVRELTKIAEAAGLRALVLPSVNELFGAPVAVQDIRPPSADDLLGRRPVDLDVERIAGYLAGKRVLVTGAGGSIGSELCRQIARFDPAELMLHDQDESGLHAVQLSLEGRALLDTPEVILGDIRDHRAMLELFAVRKPQVVFHAAALKHLPLLEQHPAEGLRTNVWGTWFVLDAAMSVGVERFVNISTDKAADPISVLGYTKAIAARLTAHAAELSGKPYLSVRFGNVLRSRGSVLHAFDSQVAAGGPLTVTDPEVTRFFMTTEEAVQLVIQSGAVGRPGEVLVLDMGEPVRISDVAQRFIESSGSALAVVFTGLRPGEKMHEVLLASNEVETRRSHPLIRHVQVDPLDPIELTEFDPYTDAAVLRAKMELLCRSAEAAPVVEPVERDENVPDLAP